MGRVNVLIEGVSGTGKTSVCRELQHRGYHAINGDRELAYQGDPVTGEPTSGRVHENHIWPVARVRTIAGRRDEELTFFCGGSRNWAAFIDVFDFVFVLSVDVETLLLRLDQRGPDEYGHTEEERAVVLRMRRTGEDIPSGGILIDSGPPIATVVDSILAHCAP